MMVGVVVQHTCAWTSYRIVMVGVLVDAETGQLREEQEGLLAAHQDTLKKVTFKEYKENKVSYILTFLVCTDTDTSIKCR